MQERKKIELGHILYLDWNVIADLEARKHPKLEEKLFKAKERKAISIPFSSTHVTEACNIASKENINSRLTYISKLSSDLYFVNDLINTGYQIETPKSVYNTISKFDLHDDIEKIFYSLINFDVMRAVRKLLMLDPSKLNNIEPKEAVDEIDKVITSKEIKDKFYKNYDEVLNFKHLIEKGVEIIENALPFKEQYYQNKYNRLQNIIIMAFLLFDSFGFWSEKRETYERGSHRVDAMHAFYGAFAELI